MYRFKECREAAGISQKSAAITVGVKPPSMSDWESGRTSPTCDKLIRLASLYGVSIDELLGVSNRKSELSPEERRLVRMFRQLNHDGRIHLLDQAESTLKIDALRQEASILSAM